MVLIPEGHFEIYGGVSNCHKIWGCYWQEPGMLGLWQCIVQSHTMKYPTQNVNSTSREYLEYQLKDRLYLISGEKPECSFLLEKTYRNLNYCAEIFTPYISLPWEEYMFSFYWWWHDCMNCFGKWDVHRWWHRGLKSAYVIGLSLLHLGNYHGKNMPRLA